jgi:hypothetical protein
MDALGCPKSAIFELMHRGKQQSLYAINSSTRERNPTRMDSAPSELQDPQN